ncbi:MAG TPA: carbamoyltransferase C-terminal domain-containing protein, partial [Puia sp.]|nr:carbamoyltransferase C-terminal domain-containing protein [Puia sp.]
AFYPSPFDEAAILTVDGVGEWATTTISHGKAGKITVLKEGRFPHSPGLLYSAFTSFLGFEVNDGEYKLMGLAAYGNPGSPETRAFREKITDRLVDIREDGSILLNMNYFQYHTGLRMVRPRKWAALFGFPRRLPDSPIRQEHMDLALAIQQVTETILITLAQTARNLTGSPRLVMAGGVALNCVANARLADAAIFDKIWIQPGAGDAGGAPGAAYAAWHLTFAPDPAKKHPLKNAYLGPEYADEDIRQTIRRHNAPHRYFTGFDDLAAFVAKLLAQGKVIGWFQHRMEFGPRALGNRSILADPGNPDMQKRLNEKVKMREGFRPFAPAILEEDCSQYFAVNPSGSSLLNYMLTVAPLLHTHRHPEPPNYAGLDLYPRLYHLRSILPAVTHLDYTARVQTVNQEQNPRFHQLLREFKTLTGYGILINTSFNVRDEPIVCTPEDAWQCFSHTHLDGLVMGNYFFDRSSIPTGNAAYDHPQISAASH